MLRLLMLELYVHPFRSLVEYLPTKVVFAVLLSPFTQFLHRAEEAVLGPPPTLVVIVVLLYLFDFVSGIRKVLVEEGPDGISSFKLRRTVAKAIDYTIFGLTVSLIASMGEHAPVGGFVLEQLDEIGLIIVGLTEARSIDENLNTSFLESAIDAIPGSEPVDQLWSDPDEDQS